MSDGTHTGELVNYGLPARVANALIEAGYDRFSDVLRASVDELLAIDNVGHNGWRQVERAKRRFTRDEPDEDTATTVRIVLNFQPSDFAKIKTAAGNEGIVTWSIRTLRAAARITGRTKDRRKA